MIGKSRVLALQLEQLLEAVHQSIDVRGEGLPEGLNDHEGALYDFILDNGEWITAALHTARNEALEEAAVKCDEVGKWSSNSARLAAKRIRALKDPP